MLVAGTRLTGTILGFAKATGSTDYYHEEIQCICSPRKTSVELPHQCIYTHTHPPTPFISAVITEDNDS